VTREPEDEREEPLVPPERLRAQFTPQARWHPELNLGIDTPGRREAVPISDRYDDHRFQVVRASTTAERVNPTLKPVDVEQMEDGCDGSPVSGQTGGNEGLQLRREPCLVLLPSGFYILRRFLEAQQHIPIVGAPRILLPKLFKYFACWPSSDRENWCKVKQVAQLEDAY
jgi:hypothetical protein